VKSADRALRVLQTLARHAKPMPTMAIARSCNVPKSSAHNLLNTMRAHGFVSYYPADHAWGLGPAAFEVGAAHTFMTAHRVPMPSAEAVSHEGAPTRRSTETHSCDGQSCAWSPTWPSAAAAG